MKVLKIFILIILFLLLSLEGLWLIAIPEGLIREKIISSIPEGIVTELDGLKKGVFFNISIERVLLKIGGESNSRGGLEIPLENIRAQIDYPSLFKGRLRIYLIAHIGEKGIIEGLGGSSELRIKAEAIKLSDIKIPLLKGEAIIAIDGEIINNKGTIRFSAQDARLEPFSERELYLPLNLINSIRGSLNIIPDKLLLESVTLSGKDLYGRLKGSINQTQADLTLELMPEKEVNSTLMLLIPKNLVSPGYYKIEIKRAL
jgi:hypothetical protein